MSVWQIRGLFIIGIAILFVVALQCGDKPDSENPRILELEADKKALEID